MGDVTIPTVLVVDDEPLVRTMLRTVLEQAGYAVAEADDGYHGLAALKRQDINVVITDIMMPNKDGIETIREIRRDHPGIGIVAMSGGGTSGDMLYLRIARALGADRILEKPMLPCELLDAVSSIRSDQPAALPVD